jgi:glutamine synthetase
MDMLEEVENVHCFFSDIRGILQSFTIPVREFTEGDAYETGIGFDGSSIRGFKSIEESDMIWMPDKPTMRIIPWINDPMQKSALIFGDVYEAYGGGVSDCDPRGYVTRRMMKEAEKMGYHTFFAPEIEYFVFESYDPTKLAYDLFVSPNGGTGDSWGPPRAMPSSPEINSGNTILRPKEAYFRAPPEDTTNDYRNELCHYLLELGVEIEYHHHEVATAGQIELDYKPKDAITCGDHFFMYKFAAQNIAKKYGWIATFMPKPIYLDNASGMHTNQSLWKGDENAMYDEDDEYGELSQVGRYYVGGLLEHAKALTVICCPTVNSYKRLVPGFEAPIYIMWSRRNRSALVRIPVYYRGREHAKSKRAEFRSADPSCNPYLAFSCQLAAGLDGIKKKIDPGDPVDEDVYKLDAQKRREYGIGELPTTLRDAIDNLTTDEVIQKALGDHVYEAFIDLKIDEWNQYCLYVTPWEIMKYLDY